MKACVFTLGCKLNEVESASLRRGLEERGWEVTDEPSRADLYLINTCAVTAEAERKSRQAVARLRKYNPDASVIVCGCASERDRESFLRRDGVTLVAGAQNKAKLLDLIGSVGARFEEENVFSELPEPKRSKTRAFLRVQDGCDRFCSYCVIPYLRGRSRSRDPERVLSEALSCGAKEIVLTGVDISSYRSADCDLAGLLRKLSVVPARIRLGSLETGVVTDGLLSAMKEAGNVVPHFHLSMQSGSSEVLKKMNRRYTREEFLRCCEKAYAAFPDAAVTTDVIVGFPSETEEDFEKTLSAVKEVGFARVHAFPFSARPGTLAAKMKDLPAAVKQARMAALLAAAKDAETAYVSRFLGRELEVLFEDDGGYSENYIRVFAEGAREGSLCRVRVVAVEGGAARGEIVRIISE